MGQKGNNFVEYALMLGLVVGIGWGVLGSYGDGTLGSLAPLQSFFKRGAKVRSRRSMTVI
jgi:hypothetical protein